ncbi:MAG TPA: DUF1800 family protein [Hyphomicrobiaceae bacterium]|nr:DUF1800 family protein [Hyphomicrobiaceae bacterium]
MAKQDTATALRRFGLGARPGDHARIAADPRGYVLAALADRQAALLDDPDLDPSHVIFTDVLTAQSAIRTARLEAKGVVGSDKAKGAPPAGPAAPAGSSAAGAPAPPKLAPNPLGRLGRLRNLALQDEIAARLERAITSDQPFIERLVMFWSAHFCVSAAKGNVRALAGAFEREAIRPHVLGRFADMLKAVEQHPAMLIYLDNQFSIGPNSIAGLRVKRGLNENLAREILELHTLGVDGGYSQVDVTNLARILTGWTFGGPQTQIGETGKFVFVANRHEPGNWTVLGKTYLDQGVMTGEAVLEDIARQPATARHIALKLARHFVSEAPPQALVAELAETFLKTGGDLAALARTLVAHPAAWSTPAVKIVPPYDFLVSLARGLGHRPKAGEFMRLSAALGQPIWMPPSPKGWPEDDNAWTGPSAIRERLRIAEMAARQIDKLADPRTVAADALGPRLSDETRQAIARAENREQGFELLIMSPEFQRR